MKRIIVGAIVVTAICGASLAIGYAIGFRRAHHRSLVLQGGTFVVSFDALEKFRSGDIAGGTDRLEALCFSSANIVYSNQHGDGFVAKTFFNALKQYRKTYRSNEAEWTNTERNLEQRLKEK